MPEPRVALLTREYPPEVYGGAGVHVEYLARELARLVEVTVHAGAPSARTRAPASRRVVAYRPWRRSPGREPLAARCEALSIDLAMAAGVGGADLVHSHTWYANLAGHLAKLCPRDPARRDRAQPRAAAPLEGRAARRRLRALVLLRADRARGAPTRSSPSPRAMRRRHPRRLPGDRPARVTVIHNGIDTDEYRPDPAPTCSSASASTPRARRCVFVGRITRQKGLAHLLDAAELLDPAAQLVLCAGAPDTPEIGAETAGRIERAARDARQRSSGSPRCCSRAPS